MSNRNQVVLVDEQDNAIGVEEKLAAHRNGLLHRAFSVFVFRQRAAKTELLLQQRHLDKYHCGGLWTNTCCSHPQLDETVIEAGEARLQEEMGFSVPLTHVGSFIYQANFANGLIEHELDHVLVGTTERQTFNVNADEVHAYRWVGVQALERDLQENPEHYTPWFGQALSISTNFCKPSVIGSTVILP